ncbi:hypothetical protein ACFX11_015011 [Malus domestica]
MRHLRPNPIPAPKRRCLVPAIQCPSALPARRPVRIWDLALGVSTRCFVGHTMDVLSVAFSIDNCQIVSASHDRTIKLWNTLGECKFIVVPGWVFHHPSLEGSAEFD